MRPWILAETNYGYTKSNPYEVAVLPMGATEPHNLHLPYATDVFEATIVGEHICQAAYEAGAKVVLLPTIPFGIESNMREFPLAIHIRPSVLDQYVTDVIHSVIHSGIRKIVILNSHGGNEMKPLLRELYGTIDAHLFLCNWYKSFQSEYASIFDHAEDHAGEMETSFALAYFGDLVAKNEDGTLTADDGATAATRFDAVNEGRISITRPWHHLTTNTGSGNPHKATAEKGRQLMEVLTRELGRFLVELSDSEIDAKFPYP